MKVAVLMGSKSDWEVMAHCSKMLDTLSVPHEVRVLSAHRTPDALFEYVASAEQRGVEAFIAAAGGAAHLAGVVAAKTLRPVQDMFYGDRSGGFEDPFGHRWHVSTHIEDVTPEEIERRMAKMKG